MIENERAMTNITLEKYMLLRSKMKSDDCGWVAGPVEDVHLLTYVAANFNSVCVG